MLIMAISVIFAIWCHALIAAFTKLSHGSIGKLAGEKDVSFVALAKHWLDNRNAYRVILRMLSLGNLAIIAILAYPLWQTWFPGDEQLAAIVCGLGITFLFVGVTELIGTGVLASRHWWLLRVSRPLLAIIRICRPLSAPLLRLQENLTAEQNGTEVTTTADEIISLVEKDANEADGADLDKAERKMIRNVIDLDETLVKEIMTPRVDIITLRENASIADVKRLIVESGHSRVPVVGKTVDDVLGIVYAKDLLNDEKISESSTVQDILHAPIYVPETKNVDDLLEEFRLNSIHIAVIIDEYGGTVGIVTIEDILEEIVGEIRDEYDAAEDEHAYVENPDGSITMDARLPIDEVNELLGLSISEDEEYDTIGGYVIAEFGHIPKPSEILQLVKHEIVILEADARRVTKLKVSPKAETVE
ncbi:MAG: putative hemolysin [Rhodothermales bacterium]|jgi:putative hemolysin